MKGIGVESYSGWNDCDPERKHIRVSIGKDGDEAYKPNGTSHHYNWRDVACASIYYLCVSPQGDPDVSNGGVSGKHQERYGYYFRAPKGQSKSKKDYRKREQCFPL